MGLACNICDPLDRAADLHERLVRPVCLTVDLINRFSGAVADLHQIFDRAVELMILLFHLLRAAREIFHVLCRLGNGFVHVADLLIDLLHLARLIRRSVRNVLHRCIHIMNGLIDRRKAVLEPGAEIIQRLCGCPDVFYNHGQYANN